MMLYIMLRSGMMGYLRAMGKPLSALPEDDLRTGALNEKENAVDLCDIACMCIFA